METGIIIPSRLLPKTGQSVSYEDGDDGDIEAGWWKGLTVADNKTRFDVRSIVGEVVVMDSATGLMWARDGNEAGCNNGNIITWANALIYANGLDFAGFDDWRLPNIMELISIINFSQNTPAIDEPPFNNTVSDKYWSSTTNALLNTLGWVLDFASGDASVVIKTTNLYMRAVRGGV